MSRKTIDLGAMRERGLLRVKAAGPALSVGMGTCGIGNGADTLFAALESAAAGRGAGTAPAIRRVGCFGFCAAEPLVMAFRPDLPVLLFSSVKPARAEALVEGVSSAEGYDRLAASADAKIERWDFRTSVIEFGPGYPALPSWNELPFFKGQEKIVLRDAGMIDPESLEEYLAVGGYDGLAKALGSEDPTSVIEELKHSKLRGRGGAGFPTWKKWELMRHAAPVASKTRYVICNADEGDPGAYMNRNEIESDPHALVEGMVIGAWAMGGATGDTVKGVVYVRAEYPLAVERLAKAIEAARGAGLLGEDILGSGFSFDIQIVTGAGAFVCGEETALIASIEGKAGRPLPRPPFPAQRGLFGAPTNINNVETWCNVPVIAARGGAWFATIGTEHSSGTKVFSLVGKASNTGLVELPLGTSLETMVYGMGGGAGPHKRVKAVQSGGPSGGCIPASKFKTRIDYEELAKLGAIMGSGGMVVMDGDNCMVDVARYFVGFTAGESCGKCTPCREGLAQMLRILDSVSRGEATLADLDVLEELALSIRDSALCGLGQTAANPVLTTLQYFRGEYERHIREQRCDAGVCESLYLALCENSCPLHMNIPGYLQLITENRLEEAFELTLRDNPLPGTMGRICHFHCRMRCRREQLDEPVSQGEIHRYLADTMYKMGREREVYARLEAEKLPPSGKRISIVGAGPAGLAAAFWLVRLGHEVTVYDAMSEAGGVPRWGIPAYRLPRDVLRKEIGLFSRLGVRFVFGTRVGTDLPWEKLAASSDAILACVGALKDMELGVPGEASPNVHPGYRFLEEIGMERRPEVGKRVLVVGGGNSAIDAARSAKRLGAEVTIVYRRSKTDMPANPKELEGALEEGIELLTMRRPVEFVPAGGPASGAPRGTAGKAGAIRVERMGAGAVDSSGRPAPAPTGEFEDIAFDDAIVAIGEHVDAVGIEALGVLLAKDGRLLADDSTLCTANPKVWAAGDAVSGAATASEAMGMARRAAQAIDRELSGAERFDTLFRPFAYANQIPLEPPMARAKGPILVPVAERRGNFIEISFGYTGEDAIVEAERCLRCDVRARARKPASAAGPGPRKQGETL